MVGIKGKEKKIGGQHIPNDWADIEEDRQIKEKTIPVIYGPD